MAQKITLDINAQPLPWSNEFRTVVDVFWITTCAQIASALRQEDDWSRLRGT
jgi:hypothetical protein